MICENKNDTFLYNVNVWQEIFGQFKAPFIRANFIWKFYCGEFHRY